MVNGNWFVLDWSQTRRKFKSNDVDHNFQIFKIEKRNASYALTEKLAGIKRV
jgi:hypothetical protein